MRTGASRSSGPSLERLFRLLADRTRLRLLNLMDGREICVCYLVEVLRIGQPKISRHLAFLRRAGLVAARREGKWMHYRIAQAKDPAVAGMLAQLKSFFAEDPEMRRDKERLGETSCAPRKFVHLRDAPVPTLVRNGGRRGRRTNAK